MTELIDMADLFPPYDPLFDDPWLKWGQAVVHTQTLETDIEVFAANAHDQPLLTHRTEYQPKRHGFAIYVDSVLIPVPVRWGLLLGDVANNYRSALDQLAWALVTRGGTPPETLTERQRRGIYFPIRQDREEFNRTLGTNLPGVRRADVAKVRSHQPYLHARRPYRHHNLVLLTDINAADKHRAIHPVWDIPEFAHYEISNERDCVLSNLPAIAERHPLKVGTEIALIKVRKTGPNPHIDVNPYVVAQPSLDDRVWLGEWLDLTLKQIFLVLADFGAPPKELMQVGIDFSRLNLDPDA